MVCADFESLVSSHDQANLAILLVFQQAERASATFFPFALSFSILGEFEHFAPHVENLFLGFFVSHGLDLLRELVDRLEVDIFRLGRFFLHR